MRVEAIKESDKKELCILILATSKQFNRDWSIILDACESSIEEHKNLHPGIVNEVQLIYLWLDDRPRMPVKSIIQVLKRCDLWTTTLDRMIAKIRNDVPVFEFNIEQMSWRTAVPWEREIIAKHLTAYVDAMSDHFELQATPGISSREVVDMIWKKYVTLSYLKQWLVDVRYQTAETIETNKTIIEKINREIWDIWQRK